MMFKALNIEKTGKLSLEEFYNIYNVTDLDWKVRTAVCERLVANGESSEKYVLRDVWNHPMSVQGWNCLEKSTRPLLIMIASCCRTKKKFFEFCQC